MRRRTEFLRDEIVVSYAGPIIIAGREPAGVPGAQFVELAGEYHRRYFHAELWSARLRRAFELARFRPTRPPDVLDVGCGSGNTVLAALELFPEANVVACDASVPPLGILDAALQERRMVGERVSLVCFDLHDAVLRDEAFDVIQGAAVLHHVTDPALVLRRLADALRPGGLMLLFEPYEDGCHLLAAMLQQILDRLEGERDRDVRQFLWAVKNDFDHRYGVGRPKPWTDLLDDKWLFTREYVRNAARVNGCGLVGLWPWEADVSSLYRNYLSELVRISGNEAMVMPPTAWSVAESFDNGIATELKERLPPEAIIILRKEEASPPG